MAGLAGLLNCCRIKPFGVLARISSALAMAPFHAVGTGSEHEFGAKRAKQHAALHAHRLRHGEDQLIALDGGHKRQANAVLPLVGSISTVSPG